jgi:hypothetical protein
MKPQINTDKHRYAQRHRIVVFYLCSSVFICGFLLLALAGCADLKGYGVSRWPLYRELPEQVALTNAEKAQLKAILPPELLERAKALNAELAYYRQIVRSHNDAAADKWLRIEKSLGADDGELEQLKTVMAAKIGRKPN